MKAIETKYGGCLFRSRLEARWAVFFDHLNIKWEYEPEGFVLSDGRYYLPDFWLPTFCHGMWVEVKPTGDDFEMARRFCHDSKTHVWLAEGTPDVRAYNVLEYDEETKGVYEWPGIPNADEARGENRMFGHPGYENRDLTIDRGYWSMLGGTFMGAVEAARSARFEHDARAVSYRQIGDG